MKHNSPLIIATHNPDKLKDFMYYLKDDVAPLHALSTYTQDAPEETGATFEDNALIKVRHSFSMTGHPSLGDDSGFCIRRLQGFPGVQSGRFATLQGKKDFPGAFDQLERMLGDHSAETDFVCVVAYKDHQCEKVFRAVLEGVFDFTKRDLPGFGYTPIFVPTHANPKQLSLSDMGDAQRRTLSPRGQALALMMVWLHESKTSS